MNSTSEHRSSVFYMPRGAGPRGDRFVGGKIIYKDSFWKIVE